MPGKDIYWGKKEADKMEKAKPNEWLLYAAALCGFCGGVFLFLPESGGADAFRRGVLCAFPGLDRKSVV